MSKEVPRLAVAGLGGPSPWAVAQVALTGIAGEEVELIREEGHLPVLPERKHEEEGYHRRESFRGDFERLSHLPARVDEEKIVARFEDGILEVRAPKAEPELSPEETKIEIQ